MFYTSMHRHSFQRVRILVVEPQADVLRTITETLTCDPRVLCLRHAAALARALPTARDFAPDIAFISIDSLDNSRSVAPQMRRSVSPVKLVLMVDGGLEALPLLKRDGIDGCVPRKASPAQLRAALGCICDGSRYYRTNQDLVISASDLPATISADELTKRELRLLFQLANGSSNKEIAYLDGLSVRTVEHSRDRLQRKLDIRDLATLTRYAISIGLVSFNTYRPQRGKSTLSKVIDANIKLY